MALAVAAGVAGVANANEVTLSHLQGLLPTSDGPVSVEGPELMGEKVNTFDGSMVFEHTDARLTGNSAIDMSIVRRHVAGRTTWIRGDFGDWDLELPRIAGVFARPRGWVTGGGGLQRCSQWGKPPIEIRTRVDPPNNNVAPAPVPPPAPVPGRVPPSAASPNADFEYYWSIYAPDDYWQGTHLHVPGSGSQEVLHRTPANPWTPTDGRSYTLVTPGGWHIGCVGSAANDPGQAFYAVSPAGVRYLFNWMSERHQPSMRKGLAPLGRAEYSLLVTQVTDRFGGQVDYVYEGSKPARLVSIRSNDGRAITLDRDTQGRIKRVFDGTREWTYNYDAQGDLSRVLRPDGSKWTFVLRPLVHYNLFELGEHANCEIPGFYPDRAYEGVVHHPSGATGKFTMRYVKHGRTQVTRLCDLMGTKEVSAHYAKAKVNLTLQSKQLTGPGMAPQVWRYDYPVSGGSWAPCVTGAFCGDRKHVSVTAPDNSVTRYTYGVRFRVNEGQLLRTEEGWNGSNALRTTDFSYRQPATGMPYPDQIGESSSRHSDYLSSRHRPQDRRVITQQGVSFTWQVDSDLTAFDHFARPMRVQHSSSLGYSKRSHTVYFDQFPSWVLGQITSVIDEQGKVPEQTVYSLATALPIEKRRFGLLTQRFEHHANGTVWKIIDPVGRATRLEDYKLGVPRLVTHRDGAVERATIDNLGKVTSYTNAFGTTTTYQYDLMGRLRQVNHPNEPDLVYHPTVIEFAPSTVHHRGLDPGHWVQHITTGEARISRWYDALWRVRLEQHEDLSTPSTTRRVVEFRHDHNGKRTYESYPQRAEVGINALLVGTHWKFDGLSREIEKRQTSEMSDLVTETRYLEGFQKLVMLPRGNQTRFAFQAFDSPSEDSIRTLWLPENVQVDISRNTHGMPLSIVRSGTFGGQTQQAARSYHYDVHMRLCKTIEPETGATVQQYDNAGNLMWTASGQNLPGAGCDQVSVPEARKVNFAYDPSDRLWRTTFGDGSPMVSRTYWADGLLRQIVSAGGGDNTINWDYYYNNRRLLTHEQYHWGDPAYSWGFSWHVDAHGNVSGLSDIWGLMVYDPDALGAARRVGNYVSNVSYHPNGMVAGYTLGNGVTHSVSLNARGLPATWQYSGVANDSYTYDANGNVSSIADGHQGRHRSMPWYDGLDRLRQANGPWGAGSFSYDALDNLVHSSVGGRSLTHTIDGNNRLVSLTGSQNIAIGYDPNGNITNRGGQAFRFDVGNRLREAVGKARYVYDGHGRRNLIWFANGDYSHNAYTQDGKLRVSSRTNEHSRRYVYLGDKLIAETTGTGVTTYSHTDALGSPVAVTDISRNEVSRTRYEPYGATEAGTTNPARIGFTGHVNDPDTGLVYMEQRYYDPVAGRFLSVDPVVTDAKTGDHFNRYVYAQNNPHRYIDPDGRAAGDPYRFPLQPGGPSSGGGLGGSGGLGKSAAAALPQMKGMGATERAQTLTQGGFHQTKVSASAAKNETWKAQDGSTVKVHSYGDQTQGPHKSGNNAHLHKEQPGPKPGEMQKLDDRGKVNTDPNKTHIGLPNPKDFTKVRGRESGS
ncbi:MAG: RHS repeat-associated core domain-containing protein [Rubrivivax sp.]|nr:RHS repeat-associated core domain-containing protein [Rubrivivax sp.]